MAKDVPLLPVCHIPLNTLLQSRHRLPAPRQEVWILESTEATVAFEWVSGLTRKTKIIEAVESPPEAFGELWRPGLAARELASEAMARQTVLDLGCGSGRDAVFLASHGLQVTAVDRLEKLLNEGRRLEHEVLGSTRIEWRTSAPEAHFDHVLMAYAFRHELIQLAMNRLKPSGKLWLEGHSKTHFRCFGSPPSELCLSADGLARYGTVLDYREEWRPDRHSAVATVINTGDFCL